MHRRCVSICIALVISIVGISVSHAQSKLRGLDNPYRVPGSYIVTLKRDDPEWQRHPGRHASPNLKEAVLAHNKNRVAQLSDELVNAYGGRVIARYDAVLKGFAIEIDESAAERLASDPRVVLVQAVEQTIVTSVQTNAPWHLDRIDEENRPLNGDYVYYRTGADVFVVILDTGVRDDHAQYDARTGGGPTWVGSTDGGWVYNDCNGHGTHVAGIAAGQTYGVAKAPYIDVQVIANCNGGGNTVDMIQGINSVTTDMETGPYVPTVANISVSTLGASTNTDVIDAINDSIQAGVIWVAAAGNHGFDACNYLPAAIPDVITVGASSRTDTLLPGTNFGTCIDLFAPGDRVRSAWPTISPQPPNCIKGTTGSSTASCEMSGTSQAAPAVTGAVAMYLESFPFATVSEVRAMLVDTATKNKMGGNLLGSPNLLLNTRVATNNLPTPPPPDPNDPDVLSVLPAIMSLILSD